MSAPCPNCETRVLIDWLSPLEVPRHPIEPDGGEGHWVPVSIPILCTNSKCGKTFHFEVPKTPKAGPFAFYGDEASREVRGQYVLVYTLLGTNDDVRTAIASKLRTAKSILLPNEDPDRWTVHMRELWSGHERLRKARFAHLKREEVREFVASLAQILRESYPDLFRCIFSSVVRAPRGKKARGAAFEQARDESFSGLLWLIMDLTRKQDVKPEFFFDATRALRSHSVIEGWVGNLFIGAQYTRLHTYLSAGRTILPPKALRPGSDPLLEIADFLAFTSARWLAQRIEGKLSDVEISEIGPGFFAGFDRRGDLRFSWAKEYPFDFLHSS